MEGILSKFIDKGKLGEKLLTPWRAGGPCRDTLTNSRMRQSASVGSSTLGSARFCARDEATLGVGQNGGQEAGEQLWKGTWGSWLMTH